MKVCIKVRELVNNFPNNFQVSRIINKELLYNLVALSQNTYKKLACQFSTLYIIKAKEFYNKKSLHVIGQCLSDPLI